MARHNAWSARPLLATHPICHRQSPRESADTCSGKLPAPPATSKPEFPHVPSNQDQSHRQSSRPAQPPPRSKNIASSRAPLAEWPAPAPHLVSPRAPTSPPPPEYPTESSALSPGRSPSRPGAAPSERDARFVLPPSRSPLH